MYLDGWMPWVVNLLQHVFEVVVPDTRQEVALWNNHVPRVVADKDVCAFGRGGCTLWVMWRIVWGADACQEVAQENITTQPM